MYLVAVPTVIPALVTLGVPPPAAHMFVFYYAVLSEVSPPVALSPFAASAITGGNPFKTTLLTSKYCLPTFLRPLLFTQPRGAPLLWGDTSNAQTALRAGSGSPGPLLLRPRVRGSL